MLTIKIDKNRQDLIVVSKQDLNNLLYTPEVLVPHEIVHDNLKILIKKNDYFKLYKVIRIFFDYIKIDDYKIVNKHDDSENDLCKLFISSDELEFLMIQCKSKGFSNYKVFLEFIIEAKQKYSPNTPLSNVDIKLPQLDLTFLALLKDYHFSQAEFKLLFELTCLNMFDINCESILFADLVEKIFEHDDYIDSLYCFDDYTNKVNQYFRNSLVHYIKNAASQKYKSTTLSILEYVTSLLYSNEWPLSKLGTNSLLFQSNDEILQTQNLLYELLLVLDNDIFLHLIYEENRIEDIVKLKALYERRIDSNDLSKSAFTNLFHTQIIKSKYIMVNLSYNVKVVKSTLTSVGLEAIFIEKIELLEKKIVESRYLTLELRDEFHQLMNDFCQNEKLGSLYLEQLIPFGYSKRNFDSICNFEILDSDYNPYCDKYFDYYLSIN